MTYKRTFTLNKFRRRIIGHIVFLVLAALGGMYIIYSKSSLILLFIVALIFVSVIIRLFRLVNRTNRDLAQFLLSIQYDDFESSFSTTTGSLQDEDKSLHEAFNLITGKFRDLRSEKEAQHQFLLSLIEQIDTGIICFDEDWQTVMMNRALKDILQKSYITSLSGIQKVDEELYHLMKALPIGEKKLMEVSIKGSRLQLALIGSQIKLQDELVRIFVIQNISTELDNQEIRSWQKLIRILTHEIMNSVSPVMSLAATTDDMLVRTDEIDDQIRGDMHKAIQAIKHRSEALLSFTERYRALTRIPPPKMETVNLLQLIDDIVTLHDAEFKKHNIEMIKLFPKHKVYIEADSGLLEQALINLVKNGIEALIGREKATIEVQVYKDNRNTVMQIADNGAGISSEMLDQIFVPFFTTKDKGSGIGLSLCRQIILMHNGTIGVQSELGKGSVFTIRL